MNTMTMANHAEPGLGQQLRAALKAKRGQYGPLVSIIVLHALFFYTIQNGMLRQAAHAVLPQAIMISFIAAPPPPPPKPSAPATPKTVKLSAPQARAIVPPPPQLAAAPTEPTITLPQPGPAEAAPLAVAAVATPPAPPAPPAPAAPRTVSSVEYIKAPQPVYPSISRRLGESGTVVLRILISERGLPEQVTVHKSSGFANLDEAGRQAALRALFKPLMENGKPVPVFVMVPLNFQLS